LMLAGPMSERPPEGRPLFLASGLPFGRHPRE
jgi:hypothetical protein